MAHSFNKESPLREINDFVVVNGELHTEFKKKQTHPNLPNNALLEYWNMYENNSSHPVIMMYGKPHLKLHYTQKLTNYVHGYSIKEKKSPFASYSQDYNIIVCLPR